MFTPLFGNQGLGKKRLFTKPFTSKTRRFSATQRERRMSELRPILGVVPLHRPRFNDLRRFAASLEACSPCGRAPPVELMLLFSTAGDQRAFFGEAPQSVAACGARTPRLVDSIVLDRQVPSAPYPYTVGWKRWYGLAQMLDANASRLLSRHEFVLLLDAETTVLSCGALNALPQRLRVLSSRRQYWWPAAATCILKMATRTRNVPAGSHCCAHCT